MFYPAGVASLEFRSEMSTNSDTSGDVVLPFDDAARKMIDPIIPQEGLNIIENELKNIQMAQTREKDMHSLNKLYRARLGSM